MIRYSIPLFFLVLKAKVDYPNNWFICSTRRSNEHVSKSIVTFPTMEPMLETIMLFGGQLCGRNIGLRAFISWEEII